MELEDSQLYPHPLSNGRKIELLQSAAASLCMFV